MDFVLPLPPNIANMRAHWAQKNRWKRRFWDECDQRQLVGLLPAPPPEPLLTAELTAHLYVWNVGDQDNAWARLKWALDWLTTRGYLIDDGPENLRIRSVEQTVDRKDQRLEMTLTEAP